MLNHVRQMEQVIQSKSLLICDLHNICNYTIGHEEAAFRNTDPATCQSYKRAAFNCPCQSLRITIFLEKGSIDSLGSPQRQHYLLQYQLFIFQFFILLNR